MSTPVRPSLAEAIRDTFTPEYLKELAESVKAMSKETFAWCPQCHENVRVSIPDIPRMVTAISTLLEQAEGKPGVVSPEEASVVLIVERPSLRGDDGEHSRPPAKDRPQGAA